MISCYVLHVKRLDLNMQYGFKWKEVNMVFKWLFLSCKSVRKILIKTWLLSMKSEEKYFVKS